jgi:hypothetical protein
MIRCSQCRGDLEQGGMLGCAASICGSILGDECIESYYFCDRCGVYTVKICFDLFLGGESVSSHGPIPRAEGDTAIELIKQCSTPWDKKCRCSAHISYFKDSALD